MKQSFASGITRNVSYRLRQLEGIRRLLIENEAEIKEALSKDLGRPEFEAIYYDVLLPLAEVEHMIKNLRSYASPESAGFSLLTFPSINQIYKEPYGVVLAIGTWNYPFMLNLVPVIGAIAAGNCVVLKPSNISPESGKLLARLLPIYVDERIIAVVGTSLNGDREMTGELMKHHWDYVFFTGSPSVGKIIYKAAAEHLTPVTLELGGKNPVVVAKDADVDLAAKRTVWGRMMNAGQQCISPDYVLCEREVINQLVERVEFWVKSMYGDNPKVNGNLGKIVGERQFDRLFDVLRSHGGQVICGGDHDLQSRYISPTVLLLNDLNSPAMEEETFGPILIIVPIDSIRDAISYINSRHKPLSLYVFSSSRITQQQLVQNTSSGGVTINGTLFHVAHPGLPFGGVGDSGLGSYHGRSTFDTFSHRKPVLKKAAWRWDFGLLSDPFFIYPPWNEKKIRIMRFLSKFA